MYGDGVDPTEDMLVNAEGEARNFRMAWSRLGDENKKLRAQLAAAEAVPERARREALSDCLHAVVRWLRDSEQRTLAQGKPRTATTVRDLADALEKWPDYAPPVQPAPAPAAEQACQCLIQGPEGAMPNHESLLLMVDGQMQNCCRKCRKPFSGKPAAPAGEKCGECGGEGRILTAVLFGKEVYTDCPKCQGPAPAEKGGGK